jgi:hypothetical protein
MPLGPRLVVRDAFEQRRDHAVEFGGRFPVHRLLQVVVRLVVNVAHPVAARRFVGGALLVPELESERGNALLDEAVLIATDEAVAQRFLIGNRLDAKRGSYSGRVVAEV